MAKNKQTYTLQIDAELGNLESKLASVKSLLSGVLNSANAPKGLDKSLGKLEGLIDKIRAKASHPIDSKAGFTSITRDVDGAQIALAELLKVLQSINSLPEADRLSFLPPDAQAQISKIVQSLADYASAIDAATAETAELVAAREKLANAEKKVADAQARVDTKQSGLDTAKAEKKAAEDAIAAIEDRKKKLAELYEEQKKIEEFYNGTDESGNKRNKSKKYDGVSMRPQDIAKKISKAELASAGDAEALEAQKAALKVAKADIASYTTQLTTANRTLREVSAEQEALAKTVDTLSQAFENAKPEQLESAYAQLRKEAEGLGVSLDGISEGYSEKDSAELIKRITDLKTKGFDQLAKATDKAEENVKDFGEECKNIKGDVEAGTEAMEKMNEAAAQQKAFEDKIKQFLGLSGAAQVLRSALRDALSTITELDATMTEMAVVTDLTVGDYWDQLPEYSKQASDLGVSINSAYKAATLYYQQGLKGNEVTKISAETLKMAKIAGLDAADATDKMTAALRGFNMELNEASAQKVSDVYSQLAAITAADVDEISTAMTKTASIASSAGMEFETTAAFLSQIIETTRESAETAGTALKTVIARFQELKKDPAEIGEVDGEIVDANAIETALRSVGVALRDSSGQFRELDDVFLELSSKWDGLDKNTQRYIATIAAGSRQQSRFIAMMSDYARTQELVASANNSAGASQKQFEKTTESLEYKIEQLKNAWHEFTMGIMNSDLVKFGVKVLTKFLDIINKATSGLKGLGGSLTKIISVVAVFKLASKVFGMIKQPLISFFADVVKMSREEGEKAGKAFDEGVKKGAAQNQEEQVDKQDNKQNEEDKTIGQKVLDKTGISDFKEGFSAKKRAREKIEANKKTALDKKTSAESKFKQIASKNSEDSKEFLDAQQELNDATKEYEKIMNDVEGEQKIMFEAGCQGAQQIAQGLSKAGEAAIATGAAVSMLGGFLTDLGLEGLGEVITGIGNGIMIAGAALTALGPIITGIVHLLKNGGKATSRAWIWVTVIAVAIAAIIAVVIGIMSFINSNSAEAKLERANEAAERASSAADEAAESYEKLSNTLDELDGKYKALENLTKGTEEWNKAVQEVNQSVLDLISAYPELASFVENKGGVLTIDQDDQGVQKVLRDAKNRVVVTSNTATTANLQVKKAEANVYHEEITDETDYDEEDSTFKNIQAQVAKALASGEIEATEGDIKSYLEATFSFSEEGAADLAETYYENIQKMQDYGKTLSQIESVQKSAYSAMAMQAQQLADTLGMTNEQIQQSQNIVDEDLVGKLYDQKLTEINDLEDEADSGDDEYNGYRLEIEKAIRAQYGSSAKLGDDGEVTYKDNEGKEQTITLNDEEMKNMIATQYATEGAKIAIENSAAATQKIYETIGAQIGDSASAKKAVNAMFMDKEGGALTQADLQVLTQSGATDYQAIWKSMTDNERAAYGKDINIMIKTFQDSINGAAEAFYKAGNDVRKHMTGEMAVTFSEKLNQFRSVDGQDNVTTEAIKKAVDIALRGKEESIQQEIQDRINATDWTSLESLKKLQIELETQYGYTEKQAKALTGTLGEQAHATSALEITVRTYGELWKATERINQSLTRVNQKLWEYNRAISGQGKVTKEALDEILSGYRFQAEQYSVAYEASQSDIATIYAGALAKYGTKLTEAVALGENGVDVDKSRLDEFIQGGAISQKEADDLISSLTKQYETSESQIEGLRNTIEAIEELEQQGREDYLELRDMVKEVIVAELQEQIDLQQQTLDATNNANTQLISKIQEQINENRQNRENEKVEQEINDLRNQQAYLSMDTSGANATTLLGLEENITNAEQSYQDSLIDQTIQKLQDANDKAAEQRERQIALTQSQLDAYQLSNQFQEDIDYQLQELLAGGTDWQNSSIGEAITEHFAKDMGLTAAEKWADEIGGKVTNADNWQNTNWGKEVTDTNLLLQSILAELGGTASGLTGEAMSNAAKANYISLTGDAGFTKLLEQKRIKSGPNGTVTGTGDNGAVTNKDSQLLTDLTKIAAMDSDKDNISNLTSSIKAKKEKADLYGDTAQAEKFDNILSKEDFYTNYDESTKEFKIDGESYKSYTDYLSKKNDQVLTGIDNLTAKEAFGGITVPSEVDNLDLAGGKGEDFDLIINGSYEDTYIEMGYQIGDQLGIDYLETVWSATKGSSGSSVVYVEKPPEGVVLPKGLYYRIGKSQWRKIREEDGDRLTDIGGGGAAFLKNSTEAIYTKYKAKAKFETGGLADFTGPAWLDGTKSRPEYVLNADQTERFFSLVDVLEGYDKDKKPEKSGDNYFEIAINVEKLENDYDVEQVADKIRKMIYEDAMYRNVNAINNMR